MSERCERPDVGVERVILRRLAYAVVVISLASSGCDSAARKATWGNNRPCIEKIDGADFFWGVPECFEALPQKTISGYWVFGFEISQFYTDLSSVTAQFNEDATPLLLGKAAGNTADQLYRREQTIVLKVTFVGAISSMHGTYGPSAEEGAYAAKFKSVEEITSQFSDAR